MKLLIQPRDGVAPILAAIKKAKTIASFEGDWAQTGLGREQDEPCDRDDEGLKPPPTLAAAAV